MSADAKFWPDENEDARRNYSGVYFWAWVSDATDGVQTSDSLEDAIREARTALASNKDNPPSMRLEPRTDEKGQFYLAGWI